MIECPRIFFTKTMKPRSKTQARRRGDWIQTHSGRAFWPLDPRAEEMAIEDVAHSLSQLCRFNGHCRRFYSVAQHSVLASRIAAPRHALWTLLHDAAEAYLGDMTRPLKKSLTAFGIAENRVLKVVAQKFGLEWPMPEAVKRADNTMLVTEARDLMSRPPSPWGMAEKPLTGKIKPWSSRVAERRFLKRFRELTSSRPTIG